MKESNYEGKSTFAKFYIPTLIMFLVVVTLIFGRAELDTTPPVMTNLTVSDIVKGSATISWNTDEGAITEIQYGLEPGHYLYRKTHEDYVTYREIQLNLLTPNITYYYVAISTDLYNNTNQSEEHTFTTLPEQDPPIWQNTLSTPITGSPYNEVEEIQLLVSWLTYMDVDTVLVQHNFSGNDTIQEMNSTDGENFSIVIPKPAEGNYYWFVTANDSINRTNQTDIFNYTITKSEPDTSLLLNSLDSNITVDAYSEVNMTGILNNSQEGKIELLINNTPIMSSSSELEKIDFFNNSGLFFISLRYNESENYSSKQINRKITVNELNLNVSPNQNEYNLGALAGYIVKFPQGATVNMEVCGPKPTEGSGFVECFTQPQISGVSSPYAQTHSYTGEIGDYIINAQTNVNGINLESTAEYKVLNSITVSIDGDLDVLQGEELDLRAKASGGIAPYYYVWRLSNGSVINDESLKVSYTNEGPQPLNLTVKDSRENERSWLFEADIHKAYTTTFEIFDKETNQPIQEANIDVGGKDKWTDSSGTISFKLKSDEYDVDITADGYKRLRQTLNVDADKTIKYELEKATEVTTTTTSTDGVSITLGLPNDGAKVYSSTVNFDAFIETNKNLECGLYLSEDGDSWSKQIKTYDIKESSGIAHTEDVELNKNYIWKVECKSGSKTYSSKTSKFSTGDTGSEESPSIVDAGEIRRELESVQDNLENLNTETQRIAEVLNLRKKAELATKEYDRIIRDLNNIKYRRDLSTAEKDAKKQEYKDQLLELEKTLPLNLELKGTNTFVYYPTMEELIKVANDYAKEKQIDNTVNENEFEDLQNKILINTVVSHVDLEMIDGSVKEITLIEKQISFSENLTPKSFILEYVPKEIVSSAKEITFVTQGEIIKDDSLIKFLTDKNIVYYVEGVKDFDSIKKTFTLLLDDGAFKKSNKNSFTGAVTLSDIDFSSPISIIILLSIIIAAYITYAFEVPEKISHLVTSASKKKTIDKIVRLIADSNDYLKTNDDERANLVFKEVKLMYEKSNEEVRSQVYEEAFKLKDAIMQHTLKNYLAK